MYKFFYLDWFLSFVYKTRKYPFYPYKWGRKKARLNVSERLRCQRIKLRGLMLGDSRIVHLFYHHDLWAPSVKYYCLRKPLIIKSFTRRIISFKNYQPKLFPTKHFSLSRTKRLTIFRVVQELDNIKERGRFLKINLFVKKQILLDFCPTWDIRARKTIRLASSLNYQFRFLKKFFRLFARLHSITALVFLRELSFLIHRGLRLALSYLKLKSSPFLFFYLPVRKELRLKKVRKKKKFKYKQFLKKFNQSLTML